jgi:hypothetical protein
LDAFLPNPPQTRHPERSAARIYRVSQLLWRAVEGPRRCLITHAALSFSATEAGQVSPSRQLYFEGYEDIRTTIIGKNDSKAGGAKGSSTPFARLIPN